MNLVAAPRMPLQASPPAPAARPEPWVCTARLRLREFCEQDRCDIVRMHQEPRVRELLVDDQPLYRHDVAAEFLRRLGQLYRRHEGLGIWCAQRMASLLSPHEQADREVRASLTPQALQQFSTPQPLFSGWFSLMPMSDREGEIELGSRLLPSAWGMGLALEGGEELLRHTFLALKRDRVWAVCHPQHEPVRYCVLSLGFSDLGVQDYAHVPARHFVLERATWLVHHMLPRRERVRHALAQLRFPARL